MDQQQHLQVGLNLKSLRKTRGFSLDKLSELTGVSKAMLAQIERGDSSPTIALLWKIANGLRVSVTSLLTEPKPSAVVVKRSTLTAIEAADGMYRSYPVFPFDPNSHLEVYMVVMDPGCVYEAEPHHEGVEEWITVQEGALVLDVGTETYSLGVHDSIRFTPDSTHTYRNNSAETTRLHVILHYPSQ